MPRQAHALQVQLLRVAADCGVTLQGQDAVARLAMVYYGAPSLPDQVIETLRQHAASNNAQVKLAHTVRKHFVEVGL